MKLPNNTQQQYLGVHLSPHLVQSVSELLSCCRARLKRCLTVTLVFKADTIDTINNDDDSSNNNNNDNNDNNNNYSGKVQQGPTQPRRDGNKGHCHAGTPTPRLPPKTHSTDSKSHTHTSL